MDSGDLRLLLGVAEGVDVPALAEDLGVSATTVRRRLRRLCGPGAAGWLRYSETDGYAVTDRGQAAVGPAKKAVTALDRIAGSLGVDEVSLAHVELIMAVVAAGSISRAARRLQLPQSSVSAKVSRVEERWATTLFVRDPTGVLCTAPLAKLLPQMALLEQAVARLSRSRPGDVPDGPVTVPGFELAVEIGFLGLIDALSADGLNVRQHVIDIPNRVWTRAMCQADICIYLDLPMVRLPVPADHETTVAFADPVYAFLPAGLAAGRSSVGLGELADQDWITGAVGSRNHSSVLALCRAAGFEPAVKFTSPHTMYARRLLEAGLAVALTSATFAPGPAVHAVRLAEDVEVRVTVGWRRGGTATDVAHRIVHWLRNSHVRRLSDIRPELLAEMRADPDRWPHLVEV